MDKLGKVIVTIVVVVLFFVVFAVIVGVREDNGAHTPGIIGLAAFAGLIAALRAIWKKDDNDFGNHKGPDIDKFDSSKALKK